MEDIRSYMLGVFAVSCLLTLVSLLRADAPTERAERVAFSVLLLAALALPTVTLVQRLPSWVTLPELTPEGEGDPLYLAAVTDAFAEGIQRTLCEEFSLAAEDVRVTVRGLSLSDMRAERITVLLGTGAYRVDHHAIEQWIEKEGWGACDVKREAG